MRTKDRWCRFALMCLVLCWLGGSLPAAGDDWPQWYGVNRDGKSAETGLLSTWPADGPPQVWAGQGAGTGYSSVAVSDGRIVTMGNHGDDEFVIAFSEADGSELWRTRNGGAYRNNRGSGPRSTPTIDGDLVYALGANGDLGCYRINDGNEVWQVNLLSTYGGGNISWGISESVLIEGDMLICSPGGQDHAMVALNKKTGEQLWATKGLNDRPGYASAVAATIGGVRQIIQMTGAAAVGIRAGDGLVMWQYHKASNDTANCTTPIVQGDHVFVTSGYGTGCALLKLTSSGDKTGSAELYFNKVMKNHFGGVVLVDGHLYGNSNKLVCMDLMTGQRKWRTNGPGKCSVIYADGHLYCLSEGGVMALVEADPNAYVEKSRFTFKEFEHFKTGGIGEEDEKPCWATPAIANGRLLLRDQDALYSYDISESASAGR